MNGLWDAENAASRAVLDGILWHFASNHQKRLPSKKSPPNQDRTREVNRTHRVDHLASSKHPHGMNIRGVGRVDGEGEGGGVSWLATENSINSHHLPMPTA